MIFESKKSYDSEGQLFAQVWEAIRTKVECSRMRNITGATILRNRVLVLNFGSATPRSVVLAQSTDTEQFGVTEEPISNLAFGIVRRQNIVKCKIEDNTIQAPNVGDRVVVSDAQAGSGTCRAIVSPLVGTITDITGFNAATNPYVLLLLRRCTAIQR